jgi:hypothetical protein
VFSGILLLASFVFFTQYAHPYFDVWAAKGWVTSPFEAGVAMGVMGIMLQTAFLAGIMLTMLRRFELPAGTMLLFFLLGGIPVAAIQENWVFVQTACIAGIAAEVAHRYLRPSAGRVRELRIFAFGVPAVWIAAYIATVAVRWGFGLGDPHVGRVDRHRRHRGVAAQLRHRPARAGRPRGVNSGLPVNAGSRPQLVSTADHLC